MADKSDLVDAYSFSRRRLVTAFVSGAPGGREVEPSRPGRTVVGGLALAVLLAAGAAVAGVLAPRTPEDWKQPGLVVSKETGAAYVILEADQDELRPVINTTSARLILGDDAEPTLISQDTIDAQRIGDDVGILGAPPSVPTSSLLIGTGWTACTGDHRGIRVRVTDSPDVTPAASNGLTVVNGGDYFVVARSDPAGPGAGGFYAYPVPAQVAPGIDQTDNLLQRVGLPPTGNAVRVPREWIHLFPIAAPLDWRAFDLGGFGGPPDELLPGDAAGAVVGDLLETADGTDLLVTRSGPVQLSAFAAQVYLDIVLPDGQLARPIEVASAPSVRRGDDAFLAETRWPAELPEPLAAEPCAQLSALPGAAPMAHLAGPSESSAADSLGQGELEPVVDPGRGGYVLSGGLVGLGERRDAVPRGREGAGRPAGRSGRRRTAWVRRRRGAGRPGQLGRALPLRCRAEPRRRAAAARGTGGRGVRRSTSWWAETRS